MIARRRASSLSFLLMAGLLVGGLGACETEDRPGAGPQTPSAVSHVKTSKDSGTKSTKKTKKANKATKNTTEKPSSPPADAKGSPSKTASLAGLVASKHKAAAVLATLTVKGKGAMTGYARENFGAAWSDVDRNGCDTRNDMLDRDLTAKTYREGTHFCIVMTGTIVSPYTGSTISFQRGDVTSLEVQIDHVVALANSWVGGAPKWDDTKRKAFANDPLNLLAVDGPSNLQKLASDASAWLPKRKAFRCTYVALQISVKSAYRLSVTSSEEAAMSGVLDTCPTQTAYTSHPVPPKQRTGKTSSYSASSSGAKTSGAKTSGKKASSSATDPLYPSCRVALEQGYGPYVQGKDAEYDWYRDGDGDGVVCE